VRTSPEQDAFERALQRVFDFVCYYLGRAVVLVGTLGRLKCDPVYVSVPRRRLRECGFHHRRAGMLFLTREGTHYVGFIAGLVLVCGVALFGYFRLGPEHEVIVENPMATPVVVVPETTPMGSTNLPDFFRNRPSASTNRSTASTNHVK
jgi:hypothetical protein